MTAHTKRKLVLRSIGVSVETYKFLSDLLFQSETLNGYGDAIDLLVREHQNCLFKIQTEQKQEELQKQDIRSYETVKPDVKELM